MPRDYLVALQMARQTASQYYVKEAHFNEPKRLASEFIKSTRPGKKTNDPTVSDICAYKCSLDHDEVLNIKYKLDWTDPLVDLPVEFLLDPKKWVLLYEERFEITPRMYKDLLSFRNIAPQHAFDFYSTLPHV
ncbi:hypothetical protein PoB_005978700 [Plakobranchus ocellatus]|uniref:Uncharacterized protein n=1 Tax=Plakobranchus ocellatus TaxID=259542 RepID=A0AAV4CMP5_9GAST|nr:hypothetical protein PoB_005978700 [Plakobranchus ocellatus]